MNHSEPLTPKYLAATGWQSSSKGKWAVWSKLLSPIRGQWAEIEVKIQFSEDGPDVSLHQGFPDTPNGHDDFVLITTRTFYTVGDLNELLLCLSPHARKT